MIRHFQTLRNTRAVQYQVADLALRLADSTRELLLEHARNHVERTGELECAICIAAAARIHHADDAARDLLW